MAFGFDELINFAKKLKRWWEKRESAKDHHPIQVPTSHQDQQLWGQPTNSSLHQNQNQMNSSNSDFVNLRNQAIAEGTLMKQKFDEAHRAYELKNGARAKVLSKEGKSHQEKRNQLNRKAAEWIFKENNRNSPPDTIDLHGLYVQESLTYAEKFIGQSARDRGPDTLYIIVGKGLHSQNFQAKLKPAIEKLIRDHHLFIELDHQNSGVLVVHRNAPVDKIGLGPQVLEKFPQSTSDPNDRCVIV